MKKIAFLINPISLKKRKLPIEKMIREAFSPSQYAVSIRYSESSGHLSALAKEAVEKGCDIVAAVGGDGTVHRVGVELIGKTSALGIVPIGSGNGFARHFNIPLDPAKAVAQIAGGITTVVDTMQVNETFALNIAGAGFDAWIARRFASSKVRGFWTYLWMAAREYLLYRTTSYVMKIDGKEVILDAFLISVCNGSEWGNGALIAPMAVADDGLLDVVAVKKIPFYAAGYFAYSLFLGGLEKFPNILHFKCREVEISSTALCCHLDGEGFESKERLVCKVLPHSLKVIIGTR